MAVGVELARNLERKLVEEDSQRLCINLAQLTGRTAGCHVGCGSTSLIGPQPSWLISAGDTQRAGAMHARKLAGCLLDRSVLSHAATYMYQNTPHVPRPSRLPGF